MSSESITVSKSASDGSKILAVDILIRSAPKTEPTALALMKTIRKDFRNVTSMETFENDVELELNGVKEGFNMSVMGLVRERDLKRFQDRLKSLKNVERITTFISA